MTDDRATIELSRPELHALLAAFEFNTTRGFGDQGPWLTNVMSVLRNKMAEAPNKQTLIPIEASIDGWSKLSGWCSHISSVCIVGHAIVTRLSGNKSEIRN